MSNYIIKRKSSYHMICKYSFTTNMTVENIFNQLKVNDFLVSCRYRTMIKEYDSENKLPEKGSTILEYFKKQTQPTYKGKQKNFFSNRLDAMISHNNKLLMVRIFNRMIYVIYAPSIQTGNDIINKLINKMTEDTSKNIDILNIISHHIILNFKVTHPLNTEILIRIKDNFFKFDIDNSNKSEKINMVPLLITPNILSIDSDLGKLRIFNRGTIIFTSIKTQDESKIIEYINNLLSEIYNCSGTCQHCNESKENNKPKLSIASDINGNEFEYEEYVPGVVYI